MKVLGCLVPFLEHDLLDSLPYTVASTLAIFPPTLHKETIDLLCSNMLPMTLGKLMQKGRNIYLPQIPRVKVGYLVCDSQDIINM